MKSYFPLFSQNIRKIFVIFITFRKLSLQKVDVSFRDDNFCENTSNISNITLAEILYSGMHPPRFICVTHENKTKTRVTFQKKINKRAHFQV
jgi:hypothetical protein